MNTTDKIIDIVILFAVVVLISLTVELIAKNLGIPATKSLCVSILIAGFLGWLLGRYHRWREK